MDRDPTFYREVYAESGNQIRSINQLRNTYLSLSAVGASALVGFWQQGGGFTSEEFGLALTVLAGVGLVLSWITWGYIQKALTRQRIITELALPAQWWTVMPLYEKPWARPIFPSERWIREHRLDLHSLAIYLTAGGWGVWLALGVPLAGIVIALAGITLGVAAVAYELWPDEADAIVVTTVAIFIAAIVYDRTT